MSVAFNILSSLVIEDGRTWGDAATPVQLGDAQAIIEGDQPYHAITRARGYSKTADVAGVIAAKAITAPAGSKLYWLAADQDQGGLALDSITGYIERTPMLQGELSVQSRRVLVPSTGTTIEVLAADAASSWGLRPYFAAVDELAQWPQTTNAQRLFEAITSAMLKVPTARLVVMTTAGSPTHFAAKVFEHARESDLWRCSETPGPAPWSDPVMLAEQKKRLPESVYANLFLNEWQETDGAFLDLSALDRCFSLKGPSIAPIDGRRYFAGLDLGHVNDASVFAMGHREGESVHLDVMQVWQGSKKRPVNFAEVQSFIENAHKRYRFDLRADPWQALSVLQRLRDNGVKATEFTFSAASKQRLASTLLQAINDGTLHLYHAPGLRDELAALRVRQTSSGGWTFDHVSGGHDDRATALALMAVAVIDQPKNTVSTQSYMPQQGPVVVREGDLTLVGRHHIDLPPRNN
jgi:phage terminase large subunit-like protein